LIFVVQVLRSFGPSWIYTWTVLLITQRRQHVFVLENYLPWALFLQCRILTAFKACFPVLLDWVNLSSLAAERRTNGFSLSQDRDQSICLPVSSLDQGEERRLAKLLNSQCKQLSTFVSRESTLNRRGFKGPFGQEVLQVTRKQAYQLVLN
jgi:hypothetical protein